MVPWKRKICLLSFILLMLVSLSLVTATEGNDQSPVAGNSRETTFNPGAGLISIYRNYISPVDGDRCPSYPTCSSYSIMAIKKHGFFMGWIMTVDRLIHEGSEETKVSPMIFSGGRWRIYDPVENNDFWWDPVKGHETE